MWQFFLLYFAVALFGVGIITLDNVFIYRLTFRELWPFNVIALSVQVVSAVLIFQVFTLIRLRQVRRFFLFEPDPARLTLVWQRLIHFPAEIFWIMVVFGLIASPLYHIAYLLSSGEPLQVYIMEAAQAILLEQTLCLILAILFYTLLRRVLRPYILSLPTDGMRDFRPATILNPLSISFTSLILIATLGPGEYVLTATSSGQPVNLLVMFAISGVSLGFALFLFLLLVLQFRDELRVLISGIFSLLEGDKAWLHRRIPIMSQDEVGQLGVAFNQLQEHTSQAYQEVQREIQLAYQVQQRLLPPSFHRIGEYNIAAVCRPMKEVGGDLYDVVSLDKERFAVVVGDVSGHGMPAALVMSAILVLLRTELRRGGSASEVLTRLNASAVETLQGEMFVTLGIGIFDRRKGSFEYASAGHVVPYVLRGGQVIQIPCSSLPLGIEREEKYSQVVIPVKPLDRFVLYTDGVIERMDERGEMVGFSGLERYLSRLDTTLGVQEQIYALLGELPMSNGTHNDDLTIIMVEYQVGDTIRESK